MDRRGGSRAVLVRRRVSGRRSGCTRGATASDAPPDAEPGLAARSNVPNTPTQHHPQRAECDGRHEHMLHDVVDGGRVWHHGMPPARSAWYTISDAT